MLRQEKEKSNNKTGRRELKNKIRHNEWTKIKS